MLLKQPQSMDECLYFSNRSIDNGQVKAWVYRKLCPKCKKAKMGKPVEKGKVKIRANDYVCPACGYEEDKTAHENSLTMEAVYTCPRCGKDGEGTTPYQRKKYQGIQSYLIVCQHCQEKIPVTKKLKGV
ncbi:MAG TPA: hypothetical protein VJC39_00170 [Candidatus Nanoarchaeia archaeon]|nr:hypothetical protein [Candidatus Nanoarchaeia archaeon]